MTQELLFPFLGYLGLAIIWGVLRAMNKTRDMLIPQLKERLVSPVPSQIMKEFS
jgi:hypothetical protein